MARQTLTMIRLEFFKRSDFEQLMAWVDTEELLMNWAGSLFSFPLTPESLEWYISDINDPANSEAMVYKAVEADTGQTVGHISLGSLSPKNRSGRITRVLVGPEYQGKGYCCQMVRALLAIGFEQMHLHRISLGVYDFNTAAIKCYQKAGMMVEGTVRDCLLYNGQWWSMVEMSMLEGEYGNLKICKCRKAEP
jgi:RimJ/RimL family protein N-acetyltransferase